MRLRRAAGLALALVCALGGALPVHAEDPAAGSVTLPDGTVLPPPPAEVLTTPSIHAEMAAANPAPPPGLAVGPEPNVALAAPEVAGRTVATQAGATAEFQVAAAAPDGRRLPNGLRKEVLGFLPYWMLPDVASLRYDLVSTIAYFGIVARADGTLADGGSGAWTSATMTNVINTAHARGVRVVPVIQMFAWDGNYAPMRQVLTSATYRGRLVNAIVATVQARRVDGVNIDFEPVPTDLRAAFTAFVREVKAALVRSGVGSYVTVDTMAGAASWATGYDVVGLTASGAADALMVMAYDFHWSGSARAGGVAPEESPYIFDATDALAAHLARVPAGKLIWGVPYYGRTWPTLNNALNGVTCRRTSPPTCPSSKVTAPGSSFAYFYTGSKSHAARYGRKWDAVGKVPWYTWWDSANTTWQQGYYDDPASLNAKYLLVQNNRLAGIGIWSLLMDAGTHDLSNVIYDRFVKLANRVAGADRYATAAALSGFAFKPGVPLAVVTTGESFPDALAGGPLAASGGGPILLVQRDRLPPVTAAELARLRPGRIVVLGGPSVVSDAVLASLRGYAAGGATRVAGRDRYATAAAASAATFAPGVPVAYLASGVTFPDGLAGGAAAGRDRGPILLVRPDHLPSVTAAELARLRPGRIVVLGGPGAVSDAVLNAVRPYTAGGVTRLGGADRYATAAVISTAGFRTDGPATVYVASGADFPDAMAAGPAAVRFGAPVLLVRPTALPSTVAAELRRLNPSRVVIVGGPSSVSEGVRAAIDALWP